MNGLHGTLSDRELPTWAVMTDRRRAHAERVVRLLDQWALALELPADEHDSWLDAGRLHDVLRDADDTVLRSLTGDLERPALLLHGPATAMRLEQDGETRADLLEAIRWHTVGSINWHRTGRALYMADFLEPGRSFMQTERAFLASCVGQCFDAVFRQVVRLRLEWAIREGKALAPETVALWNQVA